MDKSKLNLLEGGLYGIILKLGAPIAAGAAIQMLYNLADTFWLGKLGRSAITAPIISFHILFLIIALGIGFSIAATSLVSQYTGAGEIEKANKVTGNIMLYLGGGSLLFVLILFPLSDTLLRALRTPADAFIQTTSYFRIALIGIPLSFPFFVFQAVFNGYGDTKTPLKIEIVSAFLNLILDPLLIFGCLGFPAMGVKGAAIVTTCTRGLASLIALWILFSGKKGLKIEFRDFFPDRRLLRLILKTGAPASLGMSGASFGFLVLMGLVNTFGTPVVSAFGIMSRIVHLYMMPAMGIGSAVTAIVGQSLGAGMQSRAREAVTKGITLMVWIITPFILFSTFFGNQLTAIFIPGDLLVRGIGATMFLIISPSVFFFGLSSVINGAFQGSGYTIPVMVTNLSRIWLFRIPFVYLISIYFMGGPTNPEAMNGIWWGMFFSNVLSFLMIYFWYAKGNWVKARISDSGV